MLQPRVTLLTISLVTAISIMITATASLSSGLAGKRFFCSNSDLSGFGFNSEKFDIRATFIDETTINGTLHLESYWDACNWDSAMFTATRNGNSWQGDTVSFNITDDGYINNFIYSKAYDTSSTCQVTLGKLKIFGNAQPWLFLLNKEK